MVDLLNWCGFKRAASKQQKRAAAKEPENRQKRKKREPTRQWIHRREERGALHQLVKEITVEDEKGYQNFCPSHKISSSSLPTRSGQLERKPQPYPWLQGNIPSAKTSSLILDPGASSGHCVTISESVHGNHLH